MWVRSQNKKILIDAHCFTIKFSKPHTCLYADGVLVGKYKKQSDAEAMLERIENNICSSEYIVSHKVLYILGDES